MKVMKETTLHLLVTGTEMPGLRCFDGARTFEPIFLGIQKGKETIDLVPGDADQVSFTPEFRVVEGKDGRPNFLGPFAQGTANDRFFYLVWSVMKKKGEPEMFRRLKVRLGHIGWEQIENADFSPIEVRLRLTDNKECPLCATPPPTHIQWVL